MTNSLISVLFHDHRFRRPSWPLEVAGRRDLGLRSHRAGDCQSGLDPLARFRWLFRLLQLRLHLRVLWRCGIWLSRPELYVSNESGIFSGSGVGASNALRITADTSAIPAQLPPDRTYEGWASALVADAGLPTLTSPTLSDYTFSLSARAEGQTGGGDQTAQLDVSIFAPDGTIGAPDGNRDTLITLRFTSGIALGSAFQDSTMNFGSPSSIADGSIANFANFYSAANEISFAATANDAVNAFGYDAGNAMVLDNMNLGVLVVPEPSSPVMAILGGLGLAILSRRRNGGIPRSSSNSRLEWNRGH